MSQKHFGRDNLNWEMSPPDWSLGKPLKHFLEYGRTLPTVGGATSGLMVLGKKAMGSNQCSWTLHHFLPPGSCPDPALTPLSGCKWELPGNVKTWQPGNTIPTVAGCGTASPKKFSSSWRSRREDGEFDANLATQQDPATDTAKAKQSEAQGQRWSSVSRCCVCGGWRVKSCVFLYHCPPYLLRQSGAQGIHPPSTGVADANTMSSFDMWTQILVPQWQALNRLSYCSTHLSALIHNSTQHEF